MSSAVDGETDHVIADPQPLLPSENDKKEQHQHHPPQQTRAGAAPARSSSSSSSPHVASASSPVTSPRVACSPRFDHEARASLRTTLTDDAFKSYLSAESARLELWLAPVR